MDDLQRWAKDMEDKVVGEEQQNRHIYEFVQSAKWYKAMYNELRRGEKPLPDKSACDITCAHIEMIGDMASRREDR